MIVLQESSLSNTFSQTPHAAALEHKERANASSLTVPLFLIPPPPTDLQAADAEL